MRPPISLRLSLLALIAAVATGTAACATTSSAPQPSSRPSTVGSPTGQPISGQTPSQSATPTTSATAAACPGGWRTGPTSVAGQVSVPPVPIATAIRTGSHSDCRFDRLVIDISGAMPGYSARFVANVVQDASGRPITMPGTSYLVITLRPAQGYSASGTSLLPSTVQTVGDPMLKGYAVAGDFEGVLTVALGLGGGSRYRVGELSGKLYVDVAW